MSEHTAIPLREAIYLAKEWCELLRPGCVRIEPAGSVRRCKEEVHDIELVAIPEYSQGEVIDLFGATSRINKLEHVLGLLHDAGKFSYQPQNPNERRANGEKYKKLFLPSGVQLDLFVVTPPAQWGYIFTIRTGSDAFSHWLVTKRKYGGAMPSDCECKEGAVWRNGKIIPMPEEIDLFNLCGVWYEPYERGKDFTKRPVAK